MVIHRSKFKKTIGPIARGQVFYSDENLFKISRNIIKINEKTRLEEKIKITYTIKNEKDNEYHKPSRGLNVLMRYRDSKSKQGKYENPDKNLPFEILSLRGELIYREK